MTMIKFLLFNGFEIGFDPFELVEELAVFLQSLLNVGRFNDEIKGLLISLTSCFQRLWNKNSKPVDGINVISGFIYFMSFELEF